MSRARAILAGFGLAFSSAMAQDLNITRAFDDLHDAARAQRQEAEALRRLQVIQRERVRRAEEQARRQIERDSR
ncbi:hypothetical protein [Methylobacterium oxalidis]|uniref:Uncharacterized protein n=1 Tax=Methylobacterium oxalidis TaxID=944322 RepID=A0A512J4H0_9HYPH|nr:hypothetical protein [Methylobacterium oxalidis]GEP04810.1 hypothetical protein MOX02_28480 [Methylobacterium oxalidis]GJE30510.1 hypothetical protein LDDCCGHA_0678 [Methylobacterium oxalidis]GLS63636.1 hypothetical protein GCM10007888_20170 [Methylobacterium oxalidis]